MDELEIAVDRDTDCESCTGRPATTTQFLPPGCSVVVRAQRWRVESSHQHPDCAEVRLQSGSGSIALLSPPDVFAPVASEPRLRAVRLRTFARQLRRLDAGVRVDGLRVTQATARRLPYQLTPALAMAAGHSRVLLADEVGLGKTVQAGWIIADALARQPDSRILIVLPAGLKPQWQSELGTYFGIDVTAADARWLRRTAADLPGDVSPWSLPGVYLASLDFIKRAGTLRSLDHQLWDMLVIDEVHTAGSPTDRHRAVSALAERSRSLVMISATPFSGDPRGLLSITGLGAAPGDPPPLMFRRSREDVASLNRRRHRFGTVTIGKAEHRLQRSLDRYTQLVWRHAPCDADAVRLAMTVLRKRALSSPIAAWRSLERRLQLLSSATPAPTQLTLFDADEDALDDEEPSGVLAPPGMEDIGREQRWLRRLIDAARDAARDDSKLAFLRRLVRRIPRESAIVFTEYRDTLTYLSRSFPDALLLHGGLAAGPRDSIRRQFNAEGGLLLATDAAAEGLNLHARCRLVVNYELPWNPARLEQRIGRVDRIGQQRPVHAVTLIARDTAEQLVLARLVRRLHRIAATLGERDRLSAFLNEAQIAGVVIGGQRPEAASDADGACPFERAPEDRDRATVEATRLSVLARPSPLANHSSPFAFRPWPLATRLSPFAVPVSTIRSDGTFGPGFVFVVRWTALTGEGVVIDSDLRIVHVVARSVVPARTAADARLAATQAIERHGDVVRQSCDEWATARLQRASLLHAAVTRRRLDRERFLKSAHEPSPMVQPGLFDRRAHRAADGQLEARAALNEQHDRRIDTLTRSTALETQLSIAAVLIVATR
jgi:superfamily II DNA or RNA helicase